MGCSRLQDPALAAGQSPFPIPSPPHGACFPGIGFPRPCPRSQQPAPGMGSSCQPRAPPAPVTPVTRLGAREQTAGAGSPPTTVLGSASLVHWLNCRDSANEQRDCQLGFGRARFAHTGVQWLGSSAVPDPHGSWEGRGAFYETPDLDLSLFNQPSSFQTQPASLGMPRKGCSGARHGCMGLPRLLQP